MLFVLLVTGCVGQEPEEPSDNPKAISGQKLPMDWDGEYVIPISCADGGTEARFIALDALEPEKNGEPAKVNVRGFGWLADGDLLVAEICGKQQAIGKLSLFKDAKSGNGYSVEVFIFDRPQPVENK